MACSLLPKGRFLLLFHRSFSRHSRSSRRNSGPKKEGGVLSYVERCKNMLSENWRGQLTTARPKSSDSEEQKKLGRTYSQLLNYVYVDGKPIILVPESSNHCPNLLFDNRASFIVGHTDPYPLMKAFRQVKKVPPHTILVGTVSSPEDETLNGDFFKELIKKQKSELNQEVKQSSPAVKALLQTGIHVLQSHVKALSSMLDVNEADAFYTFEASSCHYVNSSGKRQAVNLQKATSNIPDIFSPLVPVILEGINKSDERRLGMRLLCAWYLQVQVEDVFIVSADRWGLNVLARTIVDSADEAPSKQHRKVPKAGANKETYPATSEWKDLRLTFLQAAEDINDFCTVLGQMEKASLVGFSQIKANMAAAMNEKQDSEADNGEGDFEADDGEGDFEAPSGGDFEPTDAEGESSTW